jgi:hypothetical protein
MELESQMSEARHQPNWMLMVVCLIAAITAVWQAMQSRGALSDLLGYVALGVGMVLFAVEAAVDAQQQVWIERTQVPAVFLTLVGIIALCLTN